MASLNRKSLEKWVLTAGITLIIVSIAAVAFSVLYRLNIQIAGVEIPKSTISYKHNLLYDFLSLGSFTFYYPANESTSLNLRFSNDQGYMITKSVAFTYSIDDQTKVIFFSLPLYASTHHSIDRLAGQVLHANLSVSGSLINDIFFSLTTTTYTQSISFSFMLVNSGYSDGFAVVELWSDEHPVWTVKYFLNAGETSTNYQMVTLPGRETHTFKLIVAQQGR